MADKKTPKQAPGAEQTREDRLKAALKANLARRKAQTRGRAQQEERRDAATDTQPGAAGQKKDA